MAKKTVENLLPVHFMCFSSTQSANSFLRVNLWQLKLKSPFRATKKCVSHNCECHSNDSIPPEIPEHIQEKKTTENM